MELGDGVNTFNLPDLRGEFIRGWDNNRGIDSGREVGSAQMDQMQRLSGSFDIRAFAGLSNQIGSFIESESQISTYSANRLSTTTPITNYDKITFNSANSPDARVSETTDGETRPRNIALMYCIKY